MIIETFAERLNLAIRQAEISVTDIPFEERVSIMGTLDELDTVEEFKVAEPILEVTRFANLIEFYRENLARWSDPRLPDYFQAKYPLLCAKLDTRPKIRVFLRGADFMPEELRYFADVFEDLLRQREEEGKVRVEYSFKYPNEDTAALRSFYFTQSQVTTLFELVFPGYIRRGYNGSRVYLDWRTSEEEKAQELK